MALVDTAHGSDKLFNMSTALILKQYFGNLVSHTVSGVGGSSLFGKYPEMGIALYRRSVMA